MKKEKKKDNRGGPGRNQGRKALYNEGTDTIAIRVPFSKKAEIKAKFDEILLSYQINATYQRDETIHQQERWNDGV